MGRSRKFVKTNAHLYPPGNLLFAPQMLWAKVETVQNDYKINKPLYIEDS